MFESNQDDAEIFAKRRLQRFALERFYVKLYLSFVFFFCLLTLILGVGVKID